MGSESNDDHLVIGPFYSIYGTEYIQVGIRTKYLISIWEYVDSSVRTVLTLRIILLRL